MFVTIIHRRLKSRHSQRMKRICLFFTLSHNAKEQNSKFTRVIRKHTRVELNYIFFGEPGEYFKQIIYFRKTIDKQSTIIIIFYNALDTGNYIELRCVKKCT